MNSVTVCLVPACSFADNAPRFCGPRGTAKRAANGPQRCLTCRAHQRTPLVWRHVAYDGGDNYQGDLLTIYRIHANHGWFLRKRSSLTGLEDSRPIFCCKRFSYNHASPRVLRQGYHPSIFFGYILVPVRYFDASPILILANRTCQILATSNHRGYPRVLLVLSILQKPIPLTASRSAAPSPREPPDK